MTNNSANNVKFISYDGKYPNLCSGTLILEIEGKTVNTISLISGGECSFSDESIEKGIWDITLNEWDNIPDIDRKLVSKYYDEIVKVVNENVPQGCCGGCL